MAIDLLMDALVGIINGVLTDIGVGVLVNENVNVIAGLMTAFEFVTSVPFEEFRC